MKKFGASMNWPTKLTGNKKGSVSDPFGDYDGDGVPNMNDCEPRNPRKQDKMISSNLLKAISRPNVHGVPPQQKVTIPEGAGSKAVIMPMPKIDTPRVTYPIRPQPTPISPKVGNPKLPQPPKIEVWPRPQPSPGRPIQLPIGPKKYPISEKIQNKNISHLKFYRDGVLTPMPGLGTKINIGSGYIPQEGDRIRQTLGNGMGFTERVYTGGQWVTRTVR